MRIRLLGGFGVDRGGLPVDGQVWRLRKARTVVKMLALTREQRLHRDVLIEALWPERTTVSAVNNLHQALHVARRVLAGDESSNGLLVLRDDFVVLLADGLLEVDVRTFERLAASARTSGDLAELRAAVAAYTGDLLPEDRFEDWATRPREELRETFTELLVDLAEAAEHEVEALDALQRALTIDPLHERAVRTLMRHHAATGRSSEALAQYERLRADLRTTYGTDPDPETQRLYGELLTGSVPVKDLPPRHNLATPLTSFVGREREIADIHRLLERGRLVTLTGVGGAGKTRLAEEAARRLLDSYDDGVWITDFVPVTDPHLVADTVTAALGLEPAAGSDSLRALITRLAPRNLLLVLDSCEHLLAACAGLASEVRRSCPGVTVLATSREPLHAPGEVTFRVPSLELPEPTDASDLEMLGALASVRLFVDRAQDVRPGFALTADNAGSVVEICRCLDGIPLALELAAARASHLEPAEIAERLGEALTLLGRPGEITRHATLRAALEWSHALLSDDEQVLLRRLAVFAGSFSLPSVERVCADDHVPAVLDCLGRLVDKSLLVVDHDGPRSRYRLLETIRQFAREHLVTAHELERLEAAHGRHFLELAADQDPERAGVAVERPQLLDADHDNLRAALGWALRNDPEQALLLGVSLSQYWLARGHFTEGADWLERILQAELAPSPQRVRAIFALAILRARSGLSHRIPGLGDDAIAVAEQSGDPADVVAARVLRGTLMLGSGDLAEIERIATDAVERAGFLGATPVAAAAHGLAAMTTLFREDVQGPAQQRFAECIRRLNLIDPATAPFFPAVTLCLPLVPVEGSMVAVFEETFLLGRRVGAVQGRGYALSAYADAHRLAGDLHAALDAVRRSVEAFTGIDDAPGLGHALNHLGCIERDQGLFDAAEEHLREALRIREQLGDRRGENLTLGNLGLLSAAAGDPGSGRRLTRVALDRGEAVDDAPAAAGALLNLAVVELYAGQRHIARMLAEQAVEALRPQGYLRLEAWTRLLAAELARDGGDTETLTRHGRVAAGIFGRLGCRIGIARTAALPISS